MALGRPAGKQASRHRRRDGSLGEGEVREGGRDAGMEGMEGMEGNARAGHEREQRAAPSKGVSFLCGKVEA